MMKAEKKLLKNYLLYFLVGLLICFIGISNVFADSYTYESLGYFNNQSQIQVEVNYNDQPLTIAINQQVQLEQVFSLDIFINNLNLSHDYIYWFEIYLPTTILTRANMAQVVWYGDNNVTGNCSIISTYFGNNYPHVTFKCDGSTNIKSLYIKYYNSSNQYLFDAQQFYWNYTYLLRRTPSSTDNTSEIKDALNQQSQDIINNQNENTNNIINNQNENTNKEIESQKVCTNTIIDKKNIKTDGYYLNSNGGQNSNSSWGITDYLELSATSTITLKVPRAGSAVSYCFYNSDKEKISCSILGTNPNIGDTYTIPANTKYVRFSINKTNNNPQYEITNLCQSGNQAITNSVNGLTSALTDSSSVSMDSLGNTAGWLPPGPIDSIINLPLNLFNNLLTAFNRTCSPLEIPLPYVNKVLPIPCISTIYGQINGFSTFWNWVGAITSVVILYNYLLQLYKYYDDLTTLKANFISDFGGAP